MDSKSKNRKWKVVSLEDKMEVIKHLDHGKILKNVAKEYQEPSQLVMVG